MHLIFSIFRIVIRLERLANIRSRGLHRIAFESALDRDTLL
jgi:hypothetical protein